jgi:hypothetical protein
VGGSGGACAESSAAGSSAANDAKASDNRIAARRSADSTSGLTLRIAASQEVNVCRFDRREAVQVPRYRRVRYDAQAMRNRPRKSSAHVTLVLLGAAALAGCGSSTEPSGGFRRDLYSSKEDCVADWGDPRDCESGPAQSSGGHSRGIWYGPTYHGGAPPGGSTGLGRRSIGSESISRGGFGASGHAHSSGGS